MQKSHFKYQCKFIVCCHCRIYHNIAERGFDANFGARPLKRAIQKYLEDPMAEVLIKANLHQGDRINIGFNSAKSEIKIKIYKKKMDLPEITDTSG